VNQRVTDVEWFTERMGFVDAFRVTGGASLHVPEHAQNAKHDLYSLDVGLHLACQANIACVLGTRNADPEIVAGGFGPQRRTADAGAIRLDGSMLLIETTIHSDGGETRMGAYVDQVVGSPDLGVVFGDARTSGDNAMFDAHKNLAAVLARRPLVDADLVRSRIGFVRWDEWFARGVSGLPVRFGADDTMTSWSYRDVTHGLGPGLKHGWLADLSGTLVSHHRFRDPGRRFSIGDVAA
jgi:hypothetical protein